MPADVQLSSTSKPVRVESHCYIDAERGADDQSANGSDLRPFKTLAYAYIQNIDTPTKTYLVRALNDSPESSGQHIWKEPAKTAVKKAQGVLTRHKEKLEKQRAVEEQQQRIRLLTLQQAKSIIVKEDSTVHKAIKIKIGNKNIELGEGTKKGTRVKVYGRIHRLRVQKYATFITLVDGYGQLQCVLEAGDLTKSHDALLFAQGTALAMYGELRKVPENHSAPDGRELLVDYYEVLGHAPSDKDSLTNRVSASSNQWDAVMLDNRHLVLRGNIASSVMKVRAAVEMAFIQVFTKLGFTKVSPPALVQGEVESGATLFKLPYYHDHTLLTQSSQLYLETVLPGLGNVYCIEKSFRAEKSLSTYSPHVISPI
jgi:asparaginyl-tRNA synthetase